MPWVRTPAIASKDESHPFPDRAIGLPILRSHPARSPRLADRGAEPSPASRSDNPLVWNANSGQGASGVTGRAAATIEFNET
jgi:hypothetical protein